MDLVAPGSDQAVEGAEAAAVARVAAVEAQAGEPEVHALFFTSADLRARNFVIFFAENFHAGAFGVFVVPGQPPVTLTGVTFQLPAAGSLPPGVSGGSGTLILIRTHTVLHFRRCIRWPGRSRRPGRRKYVILHLLSHNSLPSHISLLSVRLSLSLLSRRSACSALYLHNFWRDTVTVDC